MPRYATPTDRTPGRAAAEFSTIKTTKYSDQSNFVPFVVETGGWINAGGLEFFDKVSGALQRTGGSLLAGMQARVRRRTAAVRGVIAALVRQQAYMQIRVCVCRVCRVKVTQGSAQDTTCAPALVVQPNAKSPTSHRTVHTRGAASHTKFHRIVDTNVHRESPQEGPRVDRRVSHRLRYTRQCWHRVRAGEWRRRVHVAAGAVIATAGERQCARRSVGSLLYL